jgi:hypothetical protein
MKNNIIPLNAKRDKKPYKKVVLSEEEKSALDDLGLKSFAVEYKRLHKKVLADDFTSSEATYQLTRAQLASAIRAVGIADKAFEESGGRNAYGYVAVHGLVRELCHDVRTFGDNTELVEKVRNEVIQPILSQLATSIISQLLKAKKDLNVKLDYKMVKKVAPLLQDLSKSFVAEIAKFESIAVEKLNSTLISKG